MSIAGQSTNGNKIPNFADLLQINSVVYQREEYNYFSRGVSNVGDGAEEKQAPLQRTLSC